MQDVLLLRLKEQDPLVIWSAELAYDDVYSETLWLTMTSLFTNLRQGVPSVLS